MRNRFGLPLWSVVALMSLCLGPAARAAVTPTLETIVSTPEGFLWTYRVTVPGAEDMRDDGTIPTPGINPSDDANRIRDYVTFYDVAGLQVANPGAVQFSEAGFDYRIYALGSTPADVAPADTPVANVTIFRFAGDLQGPDEFFVALLSSFGAPTLGRYASESTNRQLATGVSGTGGIFVPGVPEPTSSVLAVLAGAALLARRRRR